MKILIADDDAVPRRMLQATLERWDYEVVEARDGEEAWQVLQGEDAPKLAILDWLMPGLDGLELCRRIRALADAPYRYLILLTGRDSKADVVEGMEAGADDYLTKPFHRHGLQVRLRAGWRILDLRECLSRLSLSAALSGRPALGDGGRRNAHREDPPRHRVQTGRREPVCGPGRVLPPALRPLPQL